jgi:predicted histidine transporter YuiF (NhaC family)
MNSMQLIYNSNMDNQSQSSDSESITDSVWFWVPIFIVGALIALMLTLPKYRERQPQIERQFQARERAGQVVSAGDGYSPISSTSTLMLTLQPLIIFFCIALFATTLFFWWRRYSFFRRANARAVLEAAEREEEGAV